jgi:replication-associated recombination protein RarA
MSKNRVRAGNPSASTFDLNKMYLHLSCLQKAIRRGQEEEAYYWDCQLIDIGKSGETQMWNRLRVIASEDIGLVGNSAVLINSLSKSFEEVKREGEETGEVAEELNNNHPDFFTSSEVIDSLAELSKAVSKHNKMIFVSHAILHLCRSPKNREVDHFIHHMNGRIRQGWKAQVPDYAYDKHTVEGRKKGRGFKHFYDEGPTELVNEKEDSKYSESARKYDLELDKEKQSK